MKIIISCQNLLISTSVASTNVFKYSVFINRVPHLRRFASFTMAKEFPPEKVRSIVDEVAKLLKERKETVSVAETVSPVLLS